MVNGQSLDSINSLMNVDVTSMKEKFLVGSKIETVDSLKLSSVSSGSLTDMLNRYFPIYVKQDAGGLSTIRFRGTSPDHTAIMFDGININSLTLGHSNMSNIPMFLFDDVKVQFGSSSSLYGTDAIGGSIQLNNKPKWGNGFNVGVEQGFASFGSYFSGLKLGYSNNKIQYSIKAFHFQKENDFPFLNTAVKDFEKNKFVDDVQKNASIKNWGILQEFNYKISDNLLFYTKQWYQNNWHQIQPNMSENYYGADYKEIENNNLRITNGLKYYKGKHKFTASLGYVYDYQLYNKNYEETISTNSIVSSLNYFNTDFLKGDFNVGLNFSHLSTDVYAYNNSPNEDRIEFFSSYKTNLRDDLSLALNLRESIVIDYTSQFAPSLMLNYIIINSDRKVLNSGASISKSFKIPTFNDRYWYPNGNPDILPENSMNYEINTDFKIYNNFNTYKIGLTAFFMNVDNWIQWAPSGNMWRPDNLAKVQSLGAEFLFNHTIKFTDFIIDWGVNYSYTNVSEVIDFWKIDFSDREQIYYTPKHVANFFSSFRYNSWQLQASTSYTGSRNTEDNKELDGYFLADMSIGKNFLFSKNILSVSFDVNNIFNKAYQNQNYYAMPGRNFGIKIKYSYN
jgi:iron complex outermembrane receptor protein